MPTAEGVARVGKSVFVKRTGQEHRDAKRDECCSERTEAEHGTVYAARDPAEDETDERGVSHGPCPVLGAIRESADGKMGQKGERYPHTAHLWWKSPTRRRVSEGAERSIALYAPVLTDFRCSAARPSADSPRKGQ